MTLTAVLTRPAPSLRFLADVTNRGDSAEAVHEDYAGQLRAEFPSWLEDNKTRTCYEWHPSVPMPASQEEFLDPAYMARFLAAVPEWLTVWGVTEDFSGVAAWDLETFASRQDLSAGSPTAWSAAFPCTDFAMGYEMVVARCLAEFKRYSPRAKWTVWGVPAVPVWDIANPATRQTARALNQRWGPALVRSFDVLNPVMYPYAMTGSVRPLFDEVACQTAQVRRPGMDAWADVCMSYPTGVLPPEQQHNQPGGGASIVPISATNLEDACESAAQGRLTGITLWGPIWDRADYVAKRQWMRDVFVPVTDRYRSKPPVTAAVAVAA